MADTDANGVLYEGIHEGPEEAMATEEAAASPAAAASSSRKRKQPVADDWSAIKDAAEAKLELQSVDDEAVKLRVQQLLDEKYQKQGGVSKAVASDETVAPRLAAERKAFFTQAMSEQETDLSKAFKAAQAAVEALAAATAQATSRKSPAKKMK